MGRAFEFAGTASLAEPRKNSKHEIRNPKQFQMIKIGKILSELIPIQCFGFADFRFVGWVCFGFRYSDFGFFQVILTKEVKP